MVRQRTGKRIHQRTLDDYRSARNWNRKFPFSFTSVIDDHLSTALATVSCRDTHDTHMRTWYIRKVRECSAERIIGTRTFLLSVIAPTPPPSHRNIVFYTSGLFLFRFPDPVLTRQTSSSRFARSCTLSHPLDILSLLPLHVCTRMHTILSMISSELELALQLRIRRGQRLSHTDAPSQFFSMNTRPTSRFVQRRRRRRRR